MTEVEKEESGYRKAQRLLLALRRAGLVPYKWIADNTRWMRKPTTYAGLGDFFDRANGTESVELDSIHPDLLRSLVRDV